MNKTISFLNLGCKVNAYETESLMSQFRDSGYNIVEFGISSDIVIINTCSVTSMADKKSRQMISRARKASPNGVIVATGCFVQLMTEEDRKSYPEIDIFIGNKEKANSLEIIESYLNQTSSQNVFVSDINNTQCEYENLRLDKTSEHTRAYLKVQDGCNQFCSYCLIPYARGRIRSKNPNIVLDEIKTLVSNGYKEIVLTGIHLSSYGLDLTPKSSLKHLLSLISDLANRLPKFRLRLGSLEPRVIDEELMLVLQNIDGFCPHFHLSLQSGCDETLKRMNRQYTASEYKSRCDLIRKYYTNPAITTDVIVGFPGEIDEEFMDSYNFVKDIKFAKTHIFKYSRRKGTRAAGFVNQVNEAIKNDRSKKMLELDQINHQDFVSRFLDKDVEVLVEKTIDIEGKLYDVGYTPEYIELMIPSDSSVPRDNVNEFRTISFKKSNTLYL